MLEKRKKPKPSTYITASSSLFISDSFTAPFLDIPLIILLRQMKQEDANPESSTVGTFFFWY
jgi:hypothetical protein